MASTTEIDKLIINSPYVEPNAFWEYNREERNFTLRKDKRRPAGYMITSGNTKSFDDPGKFVEISLANQIRPRIRQWRADGYPGVTQITKRLLEHWNDKTQRDYQFFFCQLEAIETLIWLTEAHEAHKVGIHIPSDGGLFTRLCTKMATGTGKTVVMSMLIAWQIINKVTYSKDKRFSKYVFVVAPGLTVKNRLSVIVPAADNNYFDSFNIVPAFMREMLQEGKVIVRNWHALAWDTDEKLSKKHSVDKRGAKSDEAYVREVLGEIRNIEMIVVINDEAHHAWRIEPKTKGVAKKDNDEATVWVSALDRIHNARGILKCFDFSATPFPPSKDKETPLFGWIVSDFGLNDAIESGLVKTPRIVVQDDVLPDAKHYKSRLYHIYMDDDVKADLSRKSEPEDPLPDLVNYAYYLLGNDWLETKKAWKKAGHNVPPVMITVANSTDTAARIEYTFKHEKIRINELCDRDRILRIDSKVLDKAESSEETSVEFNHDTGDENKAKKLTKEKEADLLRQTVATIGQIGKLGEKIQNVISVSMLSEGWDAKTVTHIMGLRAFSSQLLCEQVVGRGLRRTAYEVNKETELYEPEYVNIFGIPFTFLPHESVEGSVAEPPAPKTRIKPSIEKEKQFEITWPNVVRINNVCKTRLIVDLGKVNDLVLDMGSIVLLVQMAPTINGKPDLSKISQIDLEKLAKEQRMQKIIFETARDVFDQMNNKSKDKWKGNKMVLLGQIIRIVEEFMNSNKIKINPPLLATDELKRRLVITLSMRQVVEHIWFAIKQNNKESIEIIFDIAKPIRSTKDMPTWYTAKPCEPTNRSHINFCVYDSTWESCEAFELDKNPYVQAWVKNDHLGFEVTYIYRGVVKKYLPDFIIKLKNGDKLILETKGQDSEEVQAKKTAMEEWVEAVNIYGRFGQWHYDISFDPKDVDGLIRKYSKTRPA